MSNTPSTTVRIAQQQPSWAVPEDVAKVRALLADRHPLVHSNVCHALLAELESVTRGESFVLQAGDCAEPFADSRPARIGRKAAQLEQLADLLEAHAGLPVVRIGRFAGQYAKPRSKSVDARPDGTELPVYRGDAVNSAVPTIAARRADVWRLLAAFDHSAAVLDALFLNRLLPDKPMLGRSAPTYVSHEALLLDYEEPLVRRDVNRGGRYASSAHFLWIGERTRHPDGAHVAFVESINNPVGVKVGPTAAEEGLPEIVGRFTDGHPAGRLSLIVRMGASRIAECLPQVITSLGDAAQRVVWLCDPMHGNTTITANGQKSRVLTSVMDEVVAYFDILRVHGLHPGGLHLEITPDTVDECVDDMVALATVRASRRYLSACDPRLNPHQAREVVGLAARLLARRTGAETGHG